MINIPKNTRCLYISGRNDVKLKILLLLLDHWMGAREYRSIAKVKIQQIMK